MLNDDERDYDEEAANAALLRDGEDEARLQESVDEATAAAAAARQPSWDQIVSAARAFEGIRVERGTPEQERDAVERAELVGEAVVRAADAVRLVLPIIVGAVSDIRQALRK